ncbi:hypothetical protein YC2023_101055 [Brassica napus]
MAEMSKNLMTDSSARGKQRGSGGYDGCASKERPEAKKKQKLEHEPEPECGEEK